MIQVFKATWKGTTVAVKIMVLPSYMTGKDKREKMAVMETAISSSLSHPNVVQVRQLMNWSTGGVAGCCALLLPTCSSFVYYDQQKIHESAQQNQKKQCVELMWRQLSCPASSAIPTWCR